MTIDERLEKLTESHEALTQGVELLEERQIAAEEHEREMADIGREAATMRADLRRAFAMGVREARTSGGAGRNWRRKSASSPRRK